MLLKCMLVAVVLASASAVKWAECTGKSSSRGHNQNLVYQKNLQKVASVEVSGCSGKGDCILHKGKNVTFSVNFKTPDFVTKKASAVVHGIIAGLPVPFPVDNPDACKGSGITCPTAQNKQYDYQKSISVLSSYPTLRLIVKWEVKDGDNGKDLFCIKVPVRIDT